MFWLCLDYLQAQFNEIKSLPDWIYLRKGRVASCSPTLIIGIVRMQIYGDWLQIVIFFQYERGESNWKYYSLPIRIVSWSMVLPPFYLKIHKFIYCIILTKMYFRYCNSSVAACYSFLTFLVSKPLWSMISVYCICAIYIVLDRVLYLQK